MVSDSSDYVCDLDALMRMEYVMQKLKCKRYRVHVYPFSRKCALSLLLVLPLSLLLLLLLLLLATGMTCEPISFSFY
jgi:hypothetical protein